MDEETSLQPNSAIKVLDGQPPPMPFPNPPRFIYRRNPLEDVICQLRFPTILRIESASGAEFQERIRAEYPLYEEQQPILSAAFQQQVAQLVSLSGLQLQLQRRFSSEDNVWTVALTRDFIALSTKKYDRWESFHQRLSRLLGSFQEQYTPSFYSRVGLRYRNVIRRSVYDLEQSQWADLLKPHVAAEFSSDDIREQIRAATHQVLFGLDRFGAVAQMQHGTIDGENSEKCYTIDSDFFTDERTELANVTEVLAYFNEQARRLFHWCTTERLQNALEPTGVTA